MHSKRHASPGWRGLQFQRRQVSSVNHVWRHLVQGSRHGGPHSGAMSRRLVQRHEACLRVRDPIARHRYRFGQGHHDMAPVSHPIDDVDNPVLKPSGVESVHHVGDKGFVRVEIAGGHQPAIVWAGLSAAQVRGGFKGSSRQRPKPRAAASTKRQRAKRQHTGHELARGRRLGHG